MLQEPVRELGAVEPPVYDESLLVWQKRKPKPRWRRLFFHVIAISVAALLCRYVDDPHWRGGLVIGSLVLCVLYELLRKLRSTAIGRLLNGINVRASEVHTRAASTDFAVAMSICAFVFPPAIACTAFMVTALADPMARIFGIYFGTVRWHRCRKTIEGSIGCFIVALGVIMCIQPAPNIVVAVIAAAVATWAELCEQRVIKTRFGPYMTLGDNFRMPVATATALYVLSTMPALA
jgi:dolichol kinase